MIPTHLSYSSLSKWQRCNKSYQLEKIIEAPEKPAVYFAGGSAVHMATEDHDRGDRVMKSWEEYFYPEVARRMEDYGGIHWDVKNWLTGGSSSNPESPQGWMTIGPQCIENWIEFTRKDFVISPNGIELDVTTTLPGCPIPIKGFIDRVGEHVNESFGRMILDIKSGKNKPKDPLQLRIYHALMLEKFGHAPTKGAYFMAREGRIIGKPVEFTDDREEIGEMFGQVYREMVAAEAASEYPASVEFNCKWCTQQDNCLSYTGMTRQAKHFDPLYREGKPAF
jgi:hypothetical protein